MAERAPEPTAAAAGRARRSGLLRAAVSVSLLGLLLVVVDLGAASQVVAAANPYLLTLMFASLIGERLFAAWRWLVLLRTVEPRVAYWPVLRVTLISNFLGAFLPGGVGIEVLRVYGLSRVMSDLPLALSSVLMERLCGLLALLLLVALGLLFAPIALPDVVQVVLGTGLIALVLAGACLLHPWPRRVTKRALANSPLRPFAERLVGLERRVDAYARRPLALAWSLVLAFAFQLLRVLSVVIGAFALGIDAAPALFVVIVPITILVALMPISLGGLGPREASYVALLGLAGVPPEAALVLALVREALNLMTTLPGALLYARGPAVATARPAA